MQIVSVCVLSKVLSLNKLPCPQIWNIEQEKDREKAGESGRQASEAQQEKGQRGFGARDKKQRRQVFCWKNNMKIL